LEAESILMSLAAISLIQFRPPSPGILISMVVIAVLLFLSAMVSGAEVAFFSLKPRDKKILHEMDTRNSDMVLSILKKPERLLATILISNNFVNVGIVIISTFVTTQTFIFLEEPLLGFLFQVVIVTFLILLFGEIIPKIYASHNAIKFALIMAYPISVAEKVFYPVSSFLISSTSFVKKKLAAKKSNISLDDLSDALDLTTGVFTEDKKILKSIVKFSNIEVSNIMQPRLDVVSVEIDTDFQKLLDIINKSGFSRIPVYSGTFDNINGILYVKDLLPFLENSGQFSLKDLIRPCYFVPQTKKINALLQEFLERKIHMAIVVDEYGGTEGIVTLEDVLEEIVGEITDDSDEIESFFTKLDDRNYIFDAKTLLNDFYKIVQIPEESFDNIKGEADTIAGLILEIKGEIPGLNEVILLKNYSFTIISSDSRRIKKIKFTIDKPVKKTV
jgi:putative hemolysin